MAGNRKLATYRAKRDFAQTREPSGAEHTKRGHNYLIQKHAARRLHYDFRLELDGVLKSWAVTRGPSLNPDDKRLAVHVEDHPLAYGSFEGTIPKGQYGGGTVMMWDEGSWEPIGDAERGYKKGNLTLELHGKRLKGRWHLVRMHGRPNKKPDKHENWLLIKGKDQYANENGEYALEHFTRSAVSGRSMEQIAEGRKEWRSNAKAESAAHPRTQKKPVTKPTKVGKLPAFVAPQLATLVDAPPTGDNWVHEIKFDGYRLLARIENGEVRLITRANNDWTHKFKSLANNISQLKVKNALLDGEVVYQDKDGAMSFHGLQHALSSGDEKNIHYYLFDLLFMNDVDWRGQTLIERKRALRGILKKVPPVIHYSEDFDEPGAKMLHHACQIALEGIISKHTDAAYRSGRGDLWLKSKCTKEQEAVIGGYTIQPKHPGFLGALLTGFHKDGKFIFSGKVGTGFSQSEGRDLIKKLRELQQSTSPFASVPSAIRRGVLWVKPKLVAQIHFNEWTPDGRMRHPSFMGLREDKPAAEVIKEQAKHMNTKKKTTRVTAKASTQDCIIAGVKLTHPDKQLYPDGFTKRDLAEYFEKVAPLMLPHVARRPISLLRCPAGEGKQCFFQRHGSDTLSPHVKPVKVAGHGDGRPFLMIEDVKGLIGLVQMGMLEIHVWGSKAAAPDKPDRLVFDLDPAPNVPFAQVKTAAKEVRDNLKKIKLASFLKCTGGKGLHVVVPFIPGSSWKEVKNFARAFAQTMTDASPKRFTINNRKDARTTKIYIDYLRNDETASAIAPYSTRARDSASIAMPLDWGELSKLKSGHEFTLNNFQKRLKNDPWKDMLKVRQKLAL